MPLFTGCATALVTPFLSDSKVDTRALRHLIRMQLKSCVDACVLLGTTGEPNTLSMAERELIISTAAEEIQGRIPMIVGTGSCDTRKAIEYARQAKQLGAQGQLCVTPYYNKTTQAGLIRHYNAILDCCELPMILYHVPGRTGMGISAKAAATLSSHPQIAGIKDAGNDLSATADMLLHTEGRLPLYCGNDDLIVPMMALGAKGAVSVCSNILPMQIKSITTACLRGCYDAARDAQLSLLPLIRLLFSQVSPIPVKAALSMLGLISDTLRLPLTPMEEPERSRMQALIQNLQSDLQKFSP